MSEFAKTHDIGIVKICELLNGKRKTYKGWTAVEVRAVKEGTGSHTKIKKKKPKKIAMTKVASVQDITTNEIFIIDNMYDFAKKNNLNYSNLKKLINGKSKTYKNLKLYNPIEKYQIFEEPK
jgi:predicted transcriptional regulator